MLRGPNRKTTLAIFKPIDEEAMAPNNPRGHVGPFGSSSFGKAGVLSGEFCVREVAAYLLDTDGFSGVPPTTMVEVTNDDFRSLTINTFRDLKIKTECTDYVDMISAIIAPENNEEEEQKIEQNQPRSFLKIGSLQAFVVADDPIENLSCDLFDADEIHKIAILDLRMLNIDRNDTNILVKNEYFTESPSQKAQIKRTLIPIDHGLSIPDTLAICSYDLVWLSYTQSEIPFSQKSLDYIKQIDIISDIKLLEKNFKLRQECLRNMRISCTLL